ncbi:hypothetical protein VNO77_15986 [Canavalia gladiata]|uniref:Uncharacterized protein n=1 Tax=Canavalia gladiata TaxID=3824 RepID=A0AAN9M507_CANGL
MVARDIPSRMDVIHSNVIKISHFSNDNVKNVSIAIYDLVAHMGSKHWKEVEDTLASMCFRFSAFVRLQFTVALRVAYGITDFGPSHTVLNL